MGKLKIGIILGSYLEDLEIFQDFKEINCETPFGKPSSPIMSGKINEIDVAVIFRHGKKHQIPPTYINNKANIFALKYEGCKYILSTTYVNSLKEEIKIGDFVVLDDFVDFTKRRDLTFYDKFEFGAIHTFMGNPFSDFLRKKIIDSIRELNFKFHKTGTAVTLEGSRFSTKAESRIFQKFADISDMTIAPECILANEAEVPYGTIAFVKGYDSWKEEQENYEEIKQIKNDSVDKFKKIFLKVIESFSREEEIKKLIEKIQIIYDFPEKGKTFYDISPLLSDKDAVKKLSEILFERYKDKKIDAIASTESIGFALAGILADKLNAGLIFLNGDSKKNLIFQNKKILLISNVFSEKTKRICDEIKNLNGEIVESFSLIEYKKPEEVSVPYFSLMKFNEDKF